MSNPKYIHSFFRDTKIAIIAILYWISDKCVPPPCSNGGTCIIQNGQPHCNCPNGFSGLFCEISELDSS